MEGFHTFLKVTFLGHEYKLINGAILEQWGIMLFIIILVLWSTSKLDTVPRGKQIWVELVVDKVNGIVKDTMGERFLGFAPYIGTILIYLVIMNIFGMTGLEPPTSDYSIALSLALVSFVIIQATTIKHNGLGHYFTAYAKPLWFLTPLNIIERLVVPVSLSLRLFGNIFAASILMGLIHNALWGLSKMLHLGIPLGHSHMGIFQIGIPLFANAYFDLFDGIIQAIIFSMLTMIFVKTTAEHN